MVWRMLWMVNLCWYVVWGCEQFFPRLGSFNRTASQELRTQKRCLLSFSWASTFGGRRRVCVYVCVCVLESHLAWSSLALMIYHVLLGVSAKSTCAQGSRKGPRRSGCLPALADPYAPCLPCQSHYILALWQNSSAQVCTYTYTESFCDFRLPDRWKSISGVLLFDPIICSHLGNIQSIRSKKNAPVSVLSGCSPV